MLSASHHEIGSHRRKSSTTNLSAGDSNRPKRKSSSLGAPTTNLSAGDSNRPKRKSSSLDAPPTNLSAGDSNRPKRKSSSLGAPTTNLSAGDSNRPNRKRLMRSTGHNIINTGVAGKNRKYFSDLYTTLLDIKWRWNIFIFIGVFILTWVAFAGFYYLETYLHGDLDNNASSLATRPCLQNVQTFTGAFLFSIETMTTIGYGYRSQTEECPGVYLAVLLQSILGAGLQFALASLVVSKTRRAKQRSATILFSNHVCICEQDACVQLTVRLGNMRKSEIVGAHVKGYLIKKLQSGDGTMVPIRSFPLTFKSQSGRDEIFFPWPTQVLHTVDEESPLWSLSREDFRSGKYELIVVLDGICGSTSTSFQARKSYHTNELKWGFRFATMNVTYQESSYVMDLSNFHHTVPASTPLCSAQDINSLRVLYAANHREHSNEMPTSQPANEEIHKRQRVSGTENSFDDSLSPSDHSELSDEKLHTALPGETHRSHNMEEKRVEPESKATRNRRCSLGDMIRLTQGKDNDEAGYLGNAKNIYRHRKSVTDTYLGADIDIEECEDDNQAILTIVSQRSTERRTDVRDIFKKRRNSVSILFFEPKLEVSGDEIEMSPQLTQDESVQFSYSYSNTIDT